MALKKLTAGGIVPLAQWIEEISIVIYKLPEQPPGCGLIVMRGHHTAPLLPVLYCGIPDDVDKAIEEAAEKDRQEALKRSAIA